MGTVQDDPQPAKILVGTSRQKIHVQLHRVIKAINPAYLAGHRPRKVISLDELFDLRFLLIGRFEPLAIKEFDAVVFNRVMGGGDDHSRKELELPGQIGDPGSRDYPGEKHINSGGVQPSNQRPFKHLAGSSSIPADEDLGALVISLFGQD